MSKQIASALLIAALFVWGFFVYPTAAKAVYYFRATKTIEPEFISWQIDKIHEELWKLEAKFEYTIDGNSYKNQEVFQGEQFRNPYAAEQALKQLEKEKKLVWYSSDSPSKGTVERFFPFKKLAYAAITFLLILYAAWLGRYISSYFLKRSGE